MAIPFRSNCWERKQNLVILVPRVVSHGSVVTEWATISIERCAFLDIVRDLFPLSESLLTGMLAVDRGLLFCCIRYSRTASVETQIASLN